MATSANNVISQDYVTSPETTLTGLPNNATESQKKAYEAGNMIDKIGDFVDILGEKLKSIPGVGMLPAAITSIVSDLIHALSNLVEQCAEIAADHNAKDVQNKLTDTKESLQTYLNEENTSLAIQSSDKLELTPMQSEHPEFNKKSNSIAYEAGEMIEKIGDFAKSVGDSVAQIPGIGALAAPIADLVSSVIKGLGQLVEQCASIDDDANKDNNNQLSSMDTDSSHIPSTELSSGINTGK